MFVHKSKQIRRSAGQNPVWYNYMRGHTYIGDLLLTIDIRPFKEEGNPTPASESTTDARAAEFLESLRARVNSQDEAQREAWLKASKPVSKHKHNLSVNPEWLRSEKSAPDGQKKPATAQKSSTRKHAKRSSR
jgi:hypothetical protein